MNRTRQLGWTSLLLLTLVGCESPTPPATPASTPGPANDVKSLPVEEKKTSSHAKLSDTEVAEIKKLPDAEQTAALAQVVCPVSGANLGKMGTPIKQTIDGKSFYICCDGCESEVKDNPKEVLAKLNRK